MRGAAITMDQLLGFIALTSPLFLIVLWLPVCIALAVWVGRKLLKTGLPLKIVASTLIFFALLFLPFADEIAGRIYFNHLCEAEAGAKVYQTIELPAEYWDEEGKPTFYKGSRNNDIPSYAFERLGIDITAKWVEKEHRFRIHQSGTIYTDKASGQRLGEVVRFGYAGGWIAREMTLHPSSVTCGLAGSYDDLVQQQFVKKTK